MKQRTSQVEFVAGLLFGIVLGVAAKQIGSDQKKNMIHRPFSILTNVLDSNTLASTRKPSP